jgi:hypothetical protein
MITSTILSSFATNTERNMVSKFVLPLIALLVTSPVLAAPPKNAPKAVEAEQASPPSPYRETVVQINGLCMTTDNANEFVEGNDMMMLSQSISPSGNVYIWVGRDGKSIVTFLVSPDKKRACLILPNAQSKFNDETIWEIFKDKLGIKS